MSSLDKTVFLPAMDQTLFERYKKLIYDETRIVLADNKRSMISTRILKRLNLTKKQSFAEYLDFILSSNGNDELHHFINAITTNHTFFFREFSHFDFIKKKFLPEWCSTHDSDQKLNIWSAASSTGEEAYSLSMTINDWKDDEGKDLDWHIHGSDISTDVIENAKRAIYPLQSANGLPDGYLEKYFQKGKDRQDGFIRVKEFIRSSCTFSQLNLFAKTYPFTNKSPIIFCRNAMIYFDQKNQSILIEKLIEHLEPGGYLLIGHSETINNTNFPLRYVQPSIFQKI